MVVERKLLSIKTPTTVMLFQGHNQLETAERQYNTYQTKDSNEKDACPQITATATRTNHNRHVFFALDDGLKGSRDSQSAVQRD